jgi:hypothetical protein
MQIGAAYIRVSTDDQLEYSPDSQLKAIREYAKNHNIILPDDLIFVDEGISGRTAEKRPAFMRMIALAKAKHRKYEHPVHVNDFMLRGLVRCSACGSTLAQSVKGKYLQCHRYSKGQCTVSHSISIDRINNAVIERLEEDIKTGQFEIIKPKTKTDNTEMTNSLLKKEYQKLERVKQAYEDGIDTLDEYKDNKAKILKRIKELEENLQSKAKTSDKSNFAEKVFNVLEKIKSPDVVEGEKNTLLKTVVSDIIFNRAKNTVQIVYHD